MDGPFTAEQTKAFKEASLFRDDTKKLHSALEKYIDSVKVSTQHGTTVATILNDMLGAQWIQESPHIDATKYLRHLSASFRAVNSVHLKTAEMMTIGVAEPLGNFVDYDFLELQDLRKKVTHTYQDYEATRGNIESAFKGKSSKGFGMKQKKPNVPDEKVIIEFERELERLKSEQETQAADLEARLTELDQKKETKLMKHILCLLQELSDFHQKSGRILSNLQPKMEALDEELKEAEAKMSVSTKEGHLQQKSGGGWVRNFFVLKGGNLICYKGKKDAQSIETVLNIQFCTPRISPKFAKTNVFEIVSPDKKKPLMLQAESTRDRNKWVEAIQAAIEFSLTSNAADNQPSHSGNKPEEESRSFKILRRVAGNRFCADCGSPDPDWASINLGILLCLECSGVHRSLGTHISKVRSATLDTKAWEVDILMFMQEVGNERFNSVFEEDIPADFPKPKTNTERAQRERFIKAKYVARAFCIVPPNRDPAFLAAQLYNDIALRENEAVHILYLILQGADLTWQNPEDEFKTVVHNAVVYDKLTYLVALIQNGGDIFCLEERQWTPMHYAAYYHRSACAMVIYRHGFNGAKQLEYKDWQNKTAAELALTGNAEDIVSILLDKPVQVFCIDDIDTPEEEVAEEVVEEAVPAPIAAAAAPLPAQLAQMVPQHQAPGVPVQPQVQPRPGPSANSPQSALAQAMYRGPRGSTGHLGVAAIPAPIAQPQETSTRPPYIPPRPPV